MDHKDFDKIFSDKLKETQDFEFMESDWENVLGRIEVPEKQRRRAGWLWLLSLGFLMMASTSLYLAISLRETNQHLVELKEALAKSAELGEVKEHLKESGATLVQEGSSAVPTVSVQRDLKEQVSSSSAALTQEGFIPIASVQGDLKEQKEVQVLSSGAALTQEGFIPTASVSNEGLKTKDQTLKTLINSDRLNNSIQAINTKTTTLFSTDKTTNQTVSDVRLATLLPNAWTTGQVLLPKGEMEYLPVLTKVNQPKKLAWKYLSVGIIGGLSLPRQLSLSASDDQDGQSSQSEEWLTIMYKDGLPANRKIGFDAGLLLQYQLGKRWQLSGAMAYQQINYEPQSDYYVSTSKELEDKDLGEFANGVIINSLDNAVTTNVPPLYPTASDTFTFGGVTFKQKVLEYRLGANYLFRPGKKWRPYFGLSVSAISLRQQELWGNIYEDDGVASNPFSRSSAADKISNLSVKPSSFRWNGVQLSTGFQLAINQRLNWQVEAWYQQPFETRSDQLYNLAGLRTGILFGF